MSFSGGPKFNFVPESTLFSVKNFDSVLLSMVRVACRSRSYSITSNGQFCSQSASVQISKHVLHGVIEFQCTSYFSPSCPRRKIGHSKGSRCQKNMRTQLHLKNPWPPPSTYGNLGHVHMFFQRTKYNKSCVYYAYGIAIEHGRMWEVAIHVRSGSQCMTAL